MTLTPEQLRAEIADVRADIAKRVSYLEALETALSVLTARPDNATIGTMSTAQPVRYVKKNLHRGATLKSKGPIATVAKRLKMSMRGLAREIGEEYEALKKQDSRGSVTPAVQAKLDALSTRS